MTDSIWSKTPPTEPGERWMKFSPESAAQVVTVFECPAWRAPWAPAVLVSDDRKVDHLAFGDDQTFHVNEAALWGPAIPSAEELASYWKNKGRTFASPPQRDPEETDD